MGKIATKTATTQLQKIFNLLGEYGGVIETEHPGTWWPLDLEVEEILGDTKSVIIGVYSIVNGDVIFDPQFQLSLTMEKGKIVQTEIMGYLSQTLFGDCTIDENDMLHGFGSVEKDEYGLKKRFSNFMDNMTKNGPYLTSPQKIEKYDHTLAD